MEDYIFIILAIVLSVVGAINQNKKKRAAQQLSENENRPHRPSVFEQLFEDDFFNEEEPVVRPVPQPKPKPEPRIKYQPLVREEPAKAAVINYKNTPKDTSPLLQNSTPESHPIRKDFSLKKAVIYSEILKRKY